MRSRTAASVRPLSKICWLLFDGLAPSRIWSTTSRQGYLRCVHDPHVMMLKAGLIVAVFMHLALERLADYAICDRPLLLLVLVAIGRSEAEPTPTSNHAGTFSGGAGNRGATPGGAGDRDRSPVPFPDRSFRAPPGSYRRLPSAGSIAAGNVSAPSASATGWPRRIDCGTVLRDRQRVVRESFQACA